MSHFLCPLHIAIILSCMSHFSFILMNYGLQPLLFGSHFIILSFFISILGGRCLSLISLDDFLPACTTYCLCQMFVVGILRPPVRLFFHDLQSCIWLSLYVATIFVISCMLYAFMSTLGLIKPWFCGRSRARICWVSLICW